MFEETKKAKQMAKAKTQETAPDEKSAEQLEQEASTGNVFNKEKENLPATNGKVEELTMHNMNDEKFIDGVFGELDNKDEKEAIELTRNYLDFNEWKEGDKNDFIFTRMSTFTKDNGEVVPAVCLMDRNKKTWFTAAAVVVKSLEKVNKLPCAVRILYNGKVKGKNGSYYDVRVFVF